MDAEAAALAMAEAAMHEAVERERLQEYGGGVPMQDTMDAASMYAYGDQMQIAYDMDQQQQQQQLQQPQGHTEQFHAQDAELLQNLMSMPDDESRNQLLQSLLQQEQQNQMAEAARMRPQTHHLTISKEGNGTILEATDTVTGFPPDALLMNSSYDLVFDEDLPGLLCIKRQFWDEGIPDVEVIIRRRTIEGDWVWLASKAVAYVNHPVPGITLEETLVHDEELAKRLNRITRITAVLVQAVEAAWLTEAQQEEDGMQEEKQDPVSQFEQGIPASFAQPSSSILTEDIEAYKAWMQSITESGEYVAGEALQNLMQLAATQGSSAPVAVAQGSTKLEQEILEQFVGQRNKTFDPFSMMESVRKGVRLDLGLTRLYPEEVKLITAVLAGIVPINEVVPTVLDAVRSGVGLKSLASRIALDSDQKQNKLNTGSPTYQGSPPGHKLNQSTGYPSPEASQMLTQPIQGGMAFPDPIPPPIAVINLSYTYIGNSGAEMLCEILYRATTCLKSLDVSFCGIEEKGLLALARGFIKRKKNHISPLRGIILSGNHMTPRAATDIGNALSPMDKLSRPPRSVRIKRKKTGYESSSNESDDESSEFDEEEEEEDEGFGATKSSARGKKKKKEKCCVKTQGLQVLHVASASLTPAALARLLDGLGMHCPVRELNLSSNNFGPAGASALVKFLEKQQRSVDHKAMPFLDRLDMSNNNLGDDGTAQLTKAIASKRSQVQVVDLKLSSNSIGSGGIETIMNKLLMKHELLSLSLDKNTIGDQGCQLVAASLLGMRSLSRLNLSFNQIGSRGINSLMRSLITCESMTYLGLSGNILRISGAIALSFALAQHPRLEELDLDNCCLGQAAQCHIASGIISNRWVPMKRLKGYAVGPPMVAIGALKQYAASLTNEECFRIRKDEQMKTILQWTEENRNAKRNGSSIDPAILAAAGLSADSNYEQSRFLTPDFVSSINDVHGTPSQNSYFRLLGWLGQIPFDEDELTALQKYFYDADGGEGDRGSDGYINLKLRGDLLAALDSEVADEFRDELPSLASVYKGSIGVDLDKLDAEWDSWEAFKGDIADPPPSELSLSGENDKGSSGDLSMDTSNEAEDTFDKNESGDPDSRMSHAESNTSVGRAKIKPRITMFPQFEQQLEELKAAATEMIEQEDDPMQHDVILTQYAEASLTILRQLRYHCMNSGLDGWRKGGLKRKVLVVDDSNVTRKLVSRAFEKADFIVDTAANGAEGVEKLKASIYDIAFMDIDMPVMNGFEATKKLREWEDTMRPGSRQPICALTATYVDDFERSELMKFKEAGLDVMESKPCNIPRLFKVVDDVSPMFSDLTIGTMRRDRSDSRLSDSRSLSDKSLRSS